MYFPTLMLMPLYEDLDQRARCVAPRSRATAARRSRTWLRRTQARTARTARTAQRAPLAVSGCRAGAGSAGARS